MNPIALEKLRQFEAATHKRNSDRRKDDDDIKVWRAYQKTMLASVGHWLYTAYAWLFHCRRSVIKTLFQEDEPRKVLVIPQHPHPWLFIFAMCADDIEYDVTKVVNDAVKPGQLVTPEWLAETTGHTDVLRWEYADSSTFDVCEITSSGVVNEVEAD
jgi:hypothetical protein